MSYFGELRQNLRPLAAASISTGTSLPLFAYTNSVFAPHLIREFGWSRSQFAFLGVTMLAMLAILPFIGRFTDRLGVRPVAMIGTLLMPLGFIAYARMSGSFNVYLVIFTAVLVVGSMVGPMVYTRLIASSFDRAQGLALTVVNCAPAALALGVAPLLNWTIEHYGWRASYLGLGAFVFVSGLIALALADDSRITRNARATAAPLPGAAKRDYGLILRSRVFWIIFFAFLLCLLQTQLHSSSMNLMLVDKGLTAQTAANIVPVYAMGTIIGRIACGLALDRFPTPIVTAVSMALPALGYFVLGTSLDTVAVVAAAMFLVGLSVGAESDLICYLVARYFNISIYSTTLGLVFTCSFLASAVGGLGLSLTLKLTDSFSPFLFIVSGAILLGSAMFLALPKGQEKIGLIGRAVWRCSALAQRLRVMQSGVMAA